MAQDPVGIASHVGSTLESGAFYHEWLSSQCSSSPRGIVVLQHGFGEYASRYLTSHHNLIQQLTTHGYKVYALDLWGHGNSLGDRGVTNVRKAVLDHIALRKLIHSENNMSKAPLFLFGHSLGGLVTAGSVVSDGQDINGVILTGPAFPNSLPAMTTSLVEALAFIFPGMSIPKAPSPLADLGRWPGIVKDVKGDGMMIKRQVPFLLAATALRVMVEVKSKFEEWTVPTLVMHGTGDTYTDFHASEQFVKSIASRDKSLSLYKGGRHELLNDLERDRALNEILGWLNEHVEQIAVNKIS